MKGGVREAKQTDRWLVAFANLGLEDCKPRPLTPRIRQRILRPSPGGQNETGVTIAPGPPQAQSTAHQRPRRLLGRSTAREGVFVFEKGFKPGTEAPGSGLPVMFPSRGHLWQWYIVLVVLLVSSGLPTWSASAEERARPIRIGALTASWGPTPQLVALRDGLVELGYRENEQFVIGVRFTQGDLAALPTTARELVQYGVDLIFAHREHAAKAAQMATSRIPIVFVGVNDPVGLGLVQSFARPGGNITGVTDLGLALGPKRLEVFREIIPGLKRVLYPYDPTDAYSVTGVRVYRDPARRR